MNMADETNSGGGSDAADEARIRLLNTAAEMFYNEGVHRVEIDRVIEKAGVPEATLHDAFGSREELVLAYLRLRHSRTRERISRELTRYHSPRDRLVGVFEIQGMAFSEPGFRGCAFVGASGQALPGEAVERVAAEYRNWLHNMFLDLAFAAEVPYPQELAEQLVILYDGAGISAWMDHNPATVQASRSMAAALVDAALNG
jgi:AcrR family transcriptional regulator